MYANLELAEAIKKLEADGFIVGEQTKESSEEIEEDFVIRTTPEAGKIRDKETEISIYYFFWERDFCHRGL